VLGNTAPAGRRAQQAAMPQFNTNTNVDRYIQGGFINQVNGMTRRRQPDAAMGSAADMRDQINANAAELREMMRQQEQVRQEINMEASQVRREARNEAVIAPRDRRGSLLNQADRVLEAADSEHPALPDDARTSRSHAASMGGDDLDSQGVLDLDAELLNASWIDVGNNESVLMRASQQIEEEEKFPESNAKSSNVDMSVNFTPAKVKHPTRRERLAGGQKLVNKYKDDLQKSKDNAILEDAELEAEGMYELE
jgi:hypothetical protein